MYGALSAGTGCTTVPTADMTAEDEEEGEEEGEKKGEEEEGEGDKYRWVVKKENGRGNDRRVRNGKRKQEKKKKRER